MSILSDITGIDYFDLSSDITNVSKEDFAPVCDKFTGIKLCWGEPAGILDSKSRVLSFDNRFPVEENQQFPPGLEISDPSVKFDIDDFKDIFRKILCLHNGQWYFGLTQNRNKLSAKLKGSYSDLLKPAMRISYSSKHEFAPCMINDSVLGRGVNLFSGFYRLYHYDADNTGRFMFIGSREELQTALNGLEEEDLINVLANYAGYALSGYVFFISRFLMLHDRKGTGDFIRDVVRNTINLHTICLGECDVRFPIDENPRYYGSVAVFKLSNGRYGLCIGEYLVGTFSDVGVATLLEKGMHLSDSKRYMEENASEYYSDFCNWFSGLMVSKDNFRWFSQFIRYLFSLSRETFDKVEWKDPDFLASMYKGKDAGTGIEALFGWAEHENLLYRLKKLDADTVSFIQEEKGWSDSVFLNSLQLGFEKNGWLYAGISYPHLKAVMRVCSSKEIDPSGYKFTSNRSFIKPCLWDMRELKNSFSDMDISDWYMRAPASSTKSKQCTLHVKDFLVKLKEKIDSGLFHPNDSLNMSNIDVLFEKDDLSNYKNGYAKVCEYLGVTDFDYSNDVALISNGQIVCHEGCEGSNLILLPVDLSTYFWKLQSSSEMWDDHMGCEEIPDSIKKVMICLEPILPFVYPPAYVNETTEPNIYVSRVCYDSNANGSCDVYADTSIGVVRIGEKTKSFKASECCWWCCFKIEDWEKNTGMNRWTKIKVANATLDDIITGKVPV